MIKINLEIDGTPGNKENFHKNKLKIYIFIVFNYVN